MPKDFCLKSTNYDFHSENKEKVKDVKEFFEDIFVEKELIQYVLKILVSSLTFINKLSTIVLFIGSGSNGRTTLTNMIHFLIRDYAATSNEYLNCVRVTICEEPDACSIAITGDIKAITDVQAVSVDLLPIINENDKLTISNLDNALIDRILDYSTLEIPKSVINEIKSFIMNSDHIARFLDNCQYISTRSIFYSLEDFRINLIKYSIHISNISSDSNSDSESKKTVESIIGYRLI
ncbi:hypothetical protein U3516DRAFT_798147 [Neocallimastix sp. 'constans']